MKAQTGEQYLIAILEWAFLVWLIVALLVGALDYTKAFGFVGVVINQTPEPQPAPQWIVADNPRSDTRPVYSFLWFVRRDGNEKRVEVGRAPAGAPCHFGFIRESSNGREWHPYKMPDQKYGVVLCSKK